MRRRMLYDINFDNKQLQKKNQLFYIWAIPIIYIGIFVYFFFIDDILFKNEKINLSLSPNLSLIIYFIYSLFLILYLIYLFSFLFKKSNLFRSNLLFIIMMFFMYTCLFPTILFVVSNNALLINIFTYTYLIGFFIIPILKYFNKNKYEDYIIQNQRIQKNDFIITIFLFIIAIISLVDIFINKRNFLLNELFNVPVIILYLFYVLIALFVYPKFSSKLWMNLYYRKFAIEKSYLNNEKQEKKNDKNTIYQNILIKKINYNVSEIKIIYEDDSEVIFDQSFFDKKFYDIHNEKISTSANGVLDINKKEGVIHTFYINGNYRKLGLFSSNVTNLVYQIKNNQQTFTLAKKRNPWDILLSVVNMITLIFACNCFPFFFYFIIVQYFLFCKMEYWSLKKRIILKLFLLLIYILTILFFIIGLN